MSVEKTKYHFFSIQKMAHYCLLKKIYHRNVSYTHRNIKSYLLAWDGDLSAWFENSFGDIFEEGKKIRYSGTYISGKAFSQIASVAWVSEVLSSLTWKLCIRILIICWIIRNQIASRTNVDRLNKKNLMVNDWESEIKKEGETGNRNLNISGRRIYQKMTFRHQITWQIEERIFWHDSVEV